MRLAWALAWPSFPLILAISLFHAVHPGLRPAALRDLPRGSRAFHLRLHSGNRGLGNAAGLITAAPKKPKCRPSSSRARGFSERTGLSGSGVLPPIPEAHQIGWQQGFNRCGFYTQGINRPATCQSRYCPNAAVSLDPVSEAGQGPAIQPDRSTPPRPRARVSAAPWSR